jgi:hypothetical protein
MINDPKLVALAAAMIAHLSERYHSGDESGVAFIDDDGGPAFVTVDGKVDFERLAAVAMANLGILLKWVAHEKGSPECPADAKDLLVDVWSDDMHQTNGWWSKNIEWAHVIRWRPSLENWR